MLKNCVNTCSKSGSNSASNVSSNAGVASASSGKKHNKFCYLCVNYNRWAVAVGWLPFPTCVFQKRVELVSRNTNILLGIFRTLHQEPVLQLNIPEKAPVDSPVVDRRTFSGGSVVDRTL